MAAHPDAASTPRIAWAPRVVLAGRVFRLPVADPHREDPVVVAPRFRPVASRRVDATWVPAAGLSWERHAAHFTYLTAPAEAGTYPVSLSGGEPRSVAVIEPRDLLVSSGVSGGLVLPRRWRVGTPWESTKTAQTLEGDEPPRPPEPAALAFWSTAPDEVLWRQLPPAEIPKAHFVNEHRGCPVCGSELFRYGGFYPWVRAHLPCTFRSTCPACSTVFPSNCLADGDYTSGAAADDGYGYFDPQGNLFLFAATYHRDQVRAFCGGVATLTDALRSGPWDDAVARKLGVLLVRYALEELYVAAAPQWRYGPSRALEEPWPWGQEDWVGKAAGAADPASVLAARGTLHYSIDTPGYARLLAVAFDTVWPFLRADVELAERAQALGAPVGRPEEVASMVEQALACLLQCVLDFGARSNLPEESLAALVLLRAMDRPDAQDVMSWLYERGPDRLGVFCVNDFLPDGSPPEATGGYNSIHTNGLFALEHELRRLRARHPLAYPESAFPSVLHPARAARCIQQPTELTTVGRSWFQYGDGSAPGTPAVFAAKERRQSLQLEPEVFTEPLQERTFRRAREYLADPEAREAADAALAGRHRSLGTTIHDRVGIAILRTGGTPERAAAGIAYGDTSGHRHMDLGDVQLFAFGRPFLTDLGYPQSWATIGAWEGHWATHNAAWVSDPASPADRIAGRGRIVAHLAGDGVQIADVAMERWARVDGRGWRRLDLCMRRLVALLETDGDGVILVDLSRVRGGVEHWRICRGLEGAFIPAGGARGEPAGAATLLEAVRGGADGDGPEHEALRFMRDVETYGAAGFHGGSWQSREEPAAFLDLHHLGASPGTGIHAASAAQIMGTPAESLYLYRALAWRRLPTGSADPSGVDLLFEPRVGPPTVAAAWSVPVRGQASPGSGAVSVEIRTARGRSLRVSWSPWARDDEETPFEDGRLLRGTLSADTGRGPLVLPSPTRHPVVAVDWDAATVDVSTRPGEASPGQAWPGPAPGARVRCRREGPGFSYAVRGVERIGARVRLRLDVSPLLGVSRIAAVGDGYIDLADPLLTRTGYLHGARVMAGRRGATPVAVVLDAANLEGQRTRLWVRWTGPEEAPGSRVEIVDLAAGDTLEG